MMKKFILVAASIPYAFIISIAEVYYELPHQLVSYFFMMLGWIFLSFVAYKEKKLKEYFVGIIISIIISYLCILFTFSAEKWNTRFLPFESSQSFMFFIIKIVLAIEIVVWTIFLVIKAIWLAGVKLIRRKRI